MNGQAVAELPPRLRTAYRRTVYCMGPVAARIGRRCAATDRLLARNRARSGVLVTAWNPKSRRMPNGWNHRMQDALAGRLRRFVLLQAEGAWRGWREAHVLVLAPLPPIMVLARRFRQCAVVELRLGQPARLIVV